jgi:hypothetical protein
MIKIQIPLINITKNNLIIVKIIIKYSTKTKINHNSKNKHLMRLIHKMNFFQKAIKIINN